MTLPVEKSIPMSANKLSNYTSGFSDFLLPVWVYWIYLLIGQAHSTADFQEKDKTVDSMLGAPGSSTLPNARVESLKSGRARVPAHVCMEELNQAKQSC